MGCVRKSSHDVRETEKNNTTSCCPSNGNKKQKPKKKKTGGVRYLTLQKRSMKTVEKHWLGEVGIHINVISCIGFIINPLTCTCYIIAAGKALLTLWDILWVIWSDLKLKRGKETVFYLLTNITLDYVLEPALSPFELNLAITDVHWWQIRRKSWH